MNLVATYIRESIQELELVRWPTRQQAARLSTIVLIFTLISALIFGVIDLILAQLVYLLTSSLF